MEKAIESGKEHRKQYTGAKAIDCSCRNGGSCDWCRTNRQKDYIKKTEKSNIDLKEWEDEIQKHLSL